MLLQNCRQNFKYLFFSNKHWASNKHRPLRFTPCKAEQSLRGMEPQDYKKIKA